MRRRTSRQPPVLRRDELEGFLAGVQDRLSEATPSVRAQWTPELTLARSDLSENDLAGADRRLRTIDEALDELVEEPELAEFPRGLVDYVPVGGRGAPTPLDDQQLWNRIRLLGRLVALRRSQGRQVEELVSQLGAAESAYASGDRIRARAITDAVHTQLEQEGAEGPPPEP